MKNQPNQQTNHFIVGLNHFYSNKFSQVKVNQFTPFDPDLNKQLTHISFVSVK